VAASGELENIEPYLAGVRSEIEKLIVDQSLAVQILGPSPAPLQKIKGLFRFHLLLKSSSGAALNKIIHGVCMRIKTLNNMRLIFDMDPYEML
jgi:primosomal protein N' (replication factor Y)